MLPTPCSLNALDPIPKLGAKVVKLAPPAPPAPEPSDDWRYATDRDICGTAAFELVHESPRTPLEKAVDDFFVHQAAVVKAWREGLFATVDVDPAPKSTPTYPTSAEIREFYKRAALGKVTDRERNVFNERLLLDRE